MTEVMTLEILEQAIGRLERPQLHSLPMPFGASRMAMREADFKEMLDKQQTAGDSAALNHIGIGSLYGMTVVKSEMLPEDMLAVFFEELGVPVAFLYKDGSYCIPRKEDVLSLKEVLWK